MENSELQKKSPEGSAISKESFADLHNQGKATDSSKEADKENINVRGFRGWFDYRLWFAVSFYLLACIAFYQSPFYSASEFHLFKLFWDLIFAMLVMSTICWEWRLLGQINSPNLLGHFSFLCSLTFLFDRFFTRPIEVNPASFAGLLGKMIGKAASVVLQAIGDFVNNVLHLPIWLQEIFRSPLLLLLFILLCFILNMPRQKGIPSLAILFIFYLIATIANPRSGVDAWFFVGILFISIAFYLQYCDSFSHDFWKMIKRRLGEKDFFQNLAAKGALIKTSYEDGEINDSRVRTIVAQYFKIEENSPVCYRESARILKELVIRDAILSSEVSERGFTFYINPRLLENNDYFSRFPNYFRSVVIGIVALLWLLIPLDLLPDSIPIVGIIDDFFICVAGGKIVYDAFLNKELSPIRRKKK